MAARLRTYELGPRDRVGRAYAERLLRLEEVVAVFADATPEPALGEPPALAVKTAPAAARRGAPAPALGMAPAPPPSGVSAEEVAPTPASGPRKLEDVVMRARQRDRHGGGSARAPVEPTAADSPPSSPAPAPPSDPVPPRSAASTAMPGEGEDADRGAQASERSGLGWLRGGARREPPGGGHRRRPPGRR
jgi:hypothetical protein